MLRCSVVDIGSTGILVLFFSLTFSLLLIPDYISLSDVPDVEIGLSGASIQGEFISFQDLISECGPQHLLNGYCELLPSLDDAGKVYQTMLILDIVVIALFTFEVLSLRLILRRLVDRYLAQGTFNKTLLKIAKLAILGRSVFFLHPVFLNLGFVLWAIVGDFDDFQQQAQAQSGLVVAIVHNFMSLLSTAAYAYYVISSKRINIVTMIENQFKNRTENSQEAGYTKPKTRKIIPEFEDISIEID